LNFKGRASAKRYTNQILLPAVFLYQVKMAVPKKSYPKAEMLHDLLELTLSKMKNFRKAVKNSIVRFH